MIFHLADLAAPLSEAEFRAMLCRRAFTRLRGAMTPAQSALLDWPAMRALIESSPLSPDVLRMTQGTRHVEPDTYASDGKVDPAKLDALLDAGVGIIVSGLETRLRGLIALTGDVHVKLGDRLAAYAIVSTGPGGALMQHYDSEDILVLQLEGSKRWQVHAPTVANPVKGLELALPPTSAPLFDGTIEQGDILFVPAGHWHRCENGEGRSLHLAIGFEPFTGWNAAMRLVEQLQFDADFRAPLSRCETQADRDALEAKLKARLTEAIGTLSLRDFLAGKA
ncbi:MAG TPA: cupin domain-containing protein [Rhizomicrobium sp.]|jgi:hypothetical protein|nr:cupin domain-containing protein [Rhizomicrobium sp.]